MCMYLQFVYFEEREVPVIPVERSPASLSSSWDSCQGYLSSEHTFKLPSKVLVKKLVEKICQTEGKGCGGGGGWQGGWCVVARSQSGSPPKMGKGNLHCVGAFYRHKTFQILRLLWKRRQNSLFYQSILLFNIWACYAQDCYKGLMDDEK